MPYQVSNAVGFFVFNRPEHTKRVFALIRNARPQKLFIVADGPRLQNPNDTEKSKLVRRIVSEVDWPCERYENFSDTNMGCARRVSSGIDWIFSKTQASIILEDDCVPHPSFFQFCDELLNKYQVDSRIFSISGNNFLDGAPWISDSYYFSLFSHCWGWATWARAWKYFDFEMRRWPELKSSGWLKNIWKEKNTVQYYERVFDLVYGGKIDSWAYRWLFACWSHNGLTILPNRNLVSNIGFGESATHTSDAESSSANLNIFEMNFPLHHPQEIQRNYRADAYTQSRHISPSTLQSVKNFLRNKIQFPSLLKQRTGLQ